MEKFVYICNGQEFIKLIEAFGGDIQINNDIFYNENVFAVLKNEKGVIDKYDYTDELFKDRQNDKKPKELIINIVDKIKQNAKDIIYISVHPGGTSEDEIIKVLNDVNNELNNEKGQKIFVTYHGSQNSRANEIWDKEKITLDDLAALNHAVKNFIYPDINKIFRKYKTNLLIDKRLIDEAFGANFDCKRIKIIFNVKRCDESLIHRLKEYKNALDNALHLVNERYKSIYEEIRNTYN